MRRQKENRHGCPFRIPSRMQKTMKLFCTKQVISKVEGYENKEKRRRECAAELKRVEENKKAARG